MSYKATVFKVMIASPSDVAAERGIVRDALSEWNIVHADSKKVVLLPIGWDTHAVPDMGGPPQEIINKQILRDCDLLVGVFWTRIGTPTDIYASGTVEEIEEHIKAGRPAMLYFSSAPVVPESIDHDQYQRLQAFRKSCQVRGLYDSYSDLVEFRSKVVRHLQIKVLRDPYFELEPGDSLAAGEATIQGAAVRLTKEAAYLLNECAADPQGVILSVAHIGGQVLQVQGKNLIEEGSDRSRAIWMSALSELEALRYVEAASPKREIFRITRLGYEAADLLRR